MVECEKIIQSNEQEGFLVEGILIVHLRTILTNREQINYSTVCEKPLVVFKGLV